MQIWVVESEVNQYQPEKGYQKTRRPPRVFTEEEKALTYIQFLKKDGNSWYCLWHQLTPLEIF